MADFILQSDPLEFQNSRQSTKIMFLQQELQQLQDHVKDLEHIVRINKEALRIATGPQIQTPSRSKTLGASSDMNATDATDDRSQALQNLVSHLQEENMRLLDIIEKVKKERNVAQSKALISEQICEEAQRHEIETVAELEEKISDLRKLLQDKEYAIQELEKIKAVPEQEGVVVKYREVLNPTEQGIKLHNEIDALNAMLAKVSKEMNKLQSEKEHLQTINFSLTNELAKIRATFSSPLNVPPRLGLLGQIGGDADLNNSDIQAGAFQAAIGFDEDSPLPSPLPDKVFNTDANLPKGVPKLDLSKAKKIQEQIAKKIAPVQPQAPAGDYNAKVMEKINQLEDGLSMAKKRLSYEMINNKLLSDEIANLQRQVVQLVSTNELLIKSNKRYEEKWQKIFYTLEFYREFYHKYIDLITKGRTHMKTASTVIPQYDKLLKIKERFGVNLDENPDKLIKGLRRMDEENGNQMNMSILEANDSDEDKNSADADNKHKFDNLNQFSKEQCKIYLLNMAKDLHVNTNLGKSAMAKQMLKNLELQNEQGAVPKKIMKLKRSLSNPLEYVSERKKLIFDTDVTKKNKKGGKIRQDPKQVEDPGDHFFEIEEKDYVGDLDDIDKSPSQLKKQGTKKGKFEHEGDEMISFTVDADEFNKNKLVEVSFISNNDILDHIKQD